MAERESGAGALSIERVLGTAFKRRIVLSSVQRIIRSSTHTEDPSTHIYHVIGV